MLVLLLLSCRNKLYINPNDIDFRSIVSVNKEVKRKTIEKRIHYINYVTTTSFSLENSTNRKIYSHVPHFYNLILKKFTNEFPDKCMRAVVSGRTLFNPGGDGRNNPTVQ